MRKNSGFSGSKYSKHQFQPNAINPFRNTNKTINAQRLRIILYTENSQQRRNFDGGLINYYSFAPAF